MFDSHAHLNFDDFEDNYREIIRDCFDRNIKVINVGSNVKTSKRAVNIADEYKESVYAVVGVHPLHADEEEVEEVRKLAKDNKKVIAIGEIGLDKKKKETFSQQKKDFKAQLKIAEELNLPVVIHSRKAHKEVLNILEDFSVKGVVHCFTGNMTSLKKYLELGFYIGFNGIIFKLSLDKQIERTPTDRIFLETDCPYLAPPKWKGKNNPLGVISVAERVAKVKEIDFKKLEKLTDKNVKKLFNI
ncbi:MAG: TatD family hydrolase [Patescibacteria group bacterium]